MKEKFQRISQQVHLIAKKILSDSACCDGSQDKANIIAGKMDRLFVKLQSMEQVVYHMIPSLELQIKDKEKAIKKLKKSVNSQKEKIKQLQMKGNSNKNFTSYKFNYNSPFAEEQMYMKQPKENFEELKYKNKYLEAQKLLGERKQEILRLQNKIRFIIDENTKFQNEIKSQQFMIEALTAELEGTMSSDMGSILMEPATLLNQQSQLDSSFRKESEELETEDQIDEESEKLISSSNSQTLNEEVKDLKEGIEQLSNISQNTEANKMQEGPEKCWWNPLRYI